MGDFERLPRRQQTGVLALLSTPTVRAAAHEAQVGEATLRRWLGQAPFIAAYREARYQVMAEAFAQLQKACTRAVTTLLEVMEGEHTPEAVRCRAAHSVLDLAMKARSVEDLEARIAAIEHAAIPAYRA